ncbi:MAG: YCF48-related protein, partial [Ignavibacteriaceae bacterium]|nr:YCF48-related protein [Ignavibacteriaceae bacterium]
NEMMLSEFNDLNSIDMSSLTRGVAVGNSGTVLKKNNDSWFSGITNTLQDLNSVYTFSQTTAIAVGDSGVIIKSTDNYLNWTEKNSGVNVNLNSIQFIDNNVGWIVGDAGTILTSTNAGETWAPLNSGLSEIFNSVYFVNSSTGWVSGDNGTIIKTIDGGLNWTQQNPNLSGKIFKIEFCDISSGFALAQGGIILKTDNGGSTWNTIYDDPYYELYNLSFFNSSRGWSCGQYGYIYRTTNGGYSWQPQFNSPYINLRSVSIIDSNIVFSVGDDGVILLTTNGGQGPPVPVELISFTAFSNGDEVVLNWSTSTELNNHIFEIQRRLEDQEFYTIGHVEGYGTTTEHHDYLYIDKNVEKGIYCYRLKQLDYIGSIKYSNEIEVDVSGLLWFHLTQNFPNPFNPVTSIQYVVGSQSLVTLKVYDILGNEIATLVNEEKQPGTYEVEFNSSSIKHLPSSGIYFYQLKAGDYIETKKMVLIK